MLFISRVLVSQPGTESEPPAVEAWSLNHWSILENLYSLYVNEAFKYVGFGSLDTSGFQTVL